MVFKSLCVLMHWTKVAVAFEGLITGYPFSLKNEAFYNDALLHSHSKSPDVKVHVSRRYTFSL